MKIFAEIYVCWVQMWRKKGNERTRFQQKTFLLILVIILILLAAGAYGVITTQFVVTDVTVDGNEHYTDEQIREMVLPGGIRNNSLYLSLLYRKKEIKDIPFIESMDVSIVNRNTIHVDVYEKTLAGCVNYLGSYLYFDKDGIVVESDAKLTEGVPEIKGLHFDHIVMHEQLPVENPEIFKEILKVTQLFGKYEISADKIYFSPAGEVTAYFDKARVSLGTDQNIDEKVMQLASILPELAGKSGVLHMENYDASTTKITFQPE